MPAITKEKAVATKKPPIKSVAAIKGKAPAKLSGTIWDRLVDVSEVENLLKVAIYGRSGSGKTRFACSFPKPLLLIGAENGTASIRTDKGIKFIKLEQSSDLIELETIYDQFKTIVLDTGTMLQDLILKEILGLSEIPVQKSWGIATRDQYSQCGIKTKEFLRRMLEAPTNTVIISQEKEYDVKDALPDLIIPYVGSALQPSTAAWLHPSCDYILQTFVRAKTVERQTKIANKVQTTFETTTDPEYCLRLAPHPVYLSKIRVPRGKEINEIMVDPTFEKFEEIVN